MLLPLLVILGIPGPWQIVLIFLILFYPLLCIGVGAIGKNRKIGFWGAFLISFFLTPIIGIIIALISPERDRPVIKDQSKTDTAISVADELKKIQELKDAGTITDEEFTDLKNKLLKNH